MLKVGLGLRTLLCASMLFAAICSYADPVVERGFQQTLDGRSLAENAIAVVNLLVGDAALALEPAWVELPGNVSSRVAVYVVDDRQGTVVTPAAVPNGCRCVFIFPAVVTEWVRRNSAGLGRIQLDAEQFLSFILLHEVGHLKMGTPGAVFREGRLSQLNVEPSRAKVAEEDADNFAADLLKARMAKTPVGEVSLAANWVVLELTKLSWNMQAFRTLDEFGSFAVGKPLVFFDDGYSHPNLAWRILRVADRIQGSQETRYLLDAFEEARIRGANPAPLYQRQ
ncbi:hypothetical protein [Derxia lacustris]|uniref:hypothetical protein n=1 Tax=Derxia lacustris TaxID=764842 RepID=UPI00111C7773|nr:hypothetical protein [Derxia lacustris]